MPARLLCILALVLVLVLAGCGGSEDGDADGLRYSGAQVAREFQEEAGRGLTEAAGQDPAWDQLGYGLDPPPALLRRYGIFNVYVVEPGNDEAVASLLSDKATGEPLDPGADGVHWERDSQSGTWIAWKRYGENVILAWFSEAKSRRTDARFERLDRILSGLPA